MAQRTLPPERLVAFYFGMALTGIGILLFLSDFFGFMARFGDFSDFESRSRAGMMRTILGMICIAVGQLMMRFGRSGLAGSGMILDPQRTREELEPWSRMSGGILKDTLDEAGIDLAGSRSGLPFDEQLRRLEMLKREGLVSESEFLEARTKILRSLGER
jgi:hypothetical protein